MRWTSLPQRSSNTPWVQVMSRKKTVIVVIVVLSLVSQLAFYTRTMQQQEVHLAAQEGTKESQAQRGRSAQPSRAPSRNDKSSTSHSRRWVEVQLEYFKTTGFATGARGNLTHGQRLTYCDDVRQHMWRHMLANDQEFTPELVKLLQQHNTMHEAVASGRPIPGQRYLVWSLSGGLGNRFQSLSSVLLAALLSKRVLLMKDWFTPLPPNSKSNKPMIFPSSYTTDYTMEALEKLFWFSNPQLKEAGPRVPTIELLCPLFPMMSLSDFQRQYPLQFLTDEDANEATLKNVSAWKVGHVKIDISARHDKELVRWRRFACANLSASGEEQGPAQFFAEKFVYVWTNQYFLPLLFANPHHADVMRQLLPRKPYSVLIKLLVVPSLDVMLRVQQFFSKQEEAFPQNPLRPGSYTALQVRAFSHKEMPDLARGFHTCLQADRPVKPFFLATMHDAIRSNFLSKWGADVVRTQSASVAGDQMTGKGSLPDIEALTDMILLSLGKRLMVSPGSTFGMFSSAFGEIPVTRVNWKALLGAAGHSAVCEEMKSDQPCFSSWFRYDHIFQRSNLGTGKQNGNVIPCNLQQLPQDVMHC